MENSGYNGAQRGARSTVQQYPTQAGSLVTSCPNELVTQATAYCTATERVESDDSGNSYGKPDTPDTTTAKARPYTPHPSKNRKVTRRSVWLEPSRIKLVLW